MTDSSARSVAGRSRESALVRQVTKQFGLAASTVRAIDLRYLECWNARRRKAPLREMGVDEIYFGKQMKFIRVVSNSISSLMFLDNETTFCSQ